MKLECIRCGVCCFCFPCKIGREDETGKCVHLRPTKIPDVYECKLLAKKKIKPEEISIGKGCILRKRKSDIITEYYFSNLRRIREEMPYIR